MPGDLISVDEARARVLAAVRPLAAERVRAGDGLGRVLAEDVVSGFAIPPFDSSAMDGFALIAGPPAELPVVGESKAGRPFEGELQSGQAVRISTGAVIPAGADAGVPIERVGGGGGSCRSSAWRTAEARSVFLTWRPERTCGGPATMCERANSSSVRARCWDLPSWACWRHWAGWTRSARAARRPRRAITATGDELRPAGATLGPGQIHESNAAAIGALARSAGAHISAT